MSILYLPEPKKLILSQAHAASANKRWFRSSCKGGYLLARARTGLLPAGLTARDPRVEAQFANITADGLRETLLDLSGERDVVVNGQTVRIASRSTFNEEGQKNTLGYLKQAYLKLGFREDQIEIFAYDIDGVRAYVMIVTILGTKFPNEVFIYSGHDDSTAGDQFSPEPLAPGADDDGSGTTGVLHSAKGLAELGLARTVRLCHFSGEEQGLKGSQAYSDFVVDEVRQGKIKLVGMLQADMIGYTGGKNKILLAHDDGDRKGATHKLAMRIVDVSSAYGLDIDTQNAFDSDVYHDSDNGAFYDHRKVFGPDCGFGLISEGALRSNPNYHSTHDRVNSVDFHYFAEVTKLAFAVTAHEAGLQ